MFYTIIIQQTKEVECVVVENKTYCENTPMTRNDYRIIGIIFFVIALWMAGVFYATTKSLNDDEIWYVVLAFIWPLLLLAALFILV